MEGFKICILLALCYLGNSVPDFEFSIKEESSLQAVVGDISNNDVFYANMSASEIADLRFGILRPSIEPASLFSIDHEKGVLKVKRRIDRESLCDYTRTTCSLEFDVAVSSVRSSFSNIATVHINILDINDNWPSFPANEVHLNVAEGTKIGKVLKITGAMDRDSLPENTIQQYELTLAENIFSLTSVKDLDGSSVINLKLEQALDREKKSGYTFNIVAKDGGNPPKTGTLRVKVTVTDENDNPPVFVNTTYRINIKEDTPVNFTVLTLKAIDLDTGVNGQVRYDFSTMLSAKLKSLFSIDQISGDIRVAGPLTYDAGKTHKLIVVALDGGNPPLKTQTEVFVAIQDNGNNAPLVRINTLSSGETDIMEVPESATLNFFVAFVEVEDSDPGMSGNVECFTPHTSTFKLEVLTGKGYKVLLNTLLDREKKDEYELKVTCSDKGDPPLSSSANLRILVTDVNDYAPVFSKSRYNATTLENNAIGDFLVRVTASDEDFGINAQITYSFGEDANGRFRIDPNTGTISTGKSFDRETHPVINFTVLATDKGDPALVGSALVTLTVLDANDNRPQFVKPFYQLDIVENALPHTTIGHIEATDEDSGTNGEIEYFMAGSEGGVVPFEVLSNGTVRTTKMLNREEDNKYAFTALARDKGSKPLTNSVDIIVTVLDINDNKPVIIFPTSGNHTVLISVFPEPKSVIGKVIAYDADSGDNAKLRFSIVDGNNDDVFEIDNETGETMVINNWKLETNHVYDLTVRVEDSGNPVLFETTTLRVEAVFDNKTMMGNLEDGAKSDKYIVIAATVAGATCVLSLIIITAICLVLRGERRKASGDSKPDTVFDNVTATTCNKPSQAATIYGERRSNTPQIDGFNGNSLGAGKKKEVSFSLDDSAEAREMDFHPRPLNISLSRSGIVPTNNAHLNNDDIHSDTSGDTITSDSGRGGSEEEVNLHQSFDKKHQWQAPRTSNRNSSFDQYYMEKQHQEYRNNKPGQPRFLHANTNNSNNSYKQDQSFNRPKNTDYPSSHRVSSHESFRDFSNPRTMLLPYGTQGSVISHDDDASTTTSGSYTISPDDHFNDIVMGKDVIV